MLREQFLIIKYISRMRFQQHQSFFPVHPLIFFDDVCENFFPCLQVAKGLRQHKDPVSAAFPLMKSLFQFFSVFDKNFRQYSFCLL